MRKLVARENRAMRGAGGGRKVYLFADEFTDHQEAELGLTFARLLIRLGYSVERPRYEKLWKCAAEPGMPALKSPRMMPVKPPVPSVLMYLAFIAPTR